MKVIKIDIKQEILDLEPRPFYLFHKLDENFSTRIISEEDIPSDMIKIYTEEYKCVEFYNPYSKETKIFYLIKFADKEVINNLIKIENDILERKILDEVNVAVRENIKYIKGLNWWERLFKKF